MTNVRQDSNFKSSSIAKSIDAFINDPGARDFAVYRILTWNMSGLHLRGSITLVSSRSFKEMEVSQMITFKSLEDRHFQRTEVEAVAISQKAVTLKATDQNTFELIADGCVFFEGNAVESNTKSRNFGLESPDTYASVSSN